MSQDETRRGTWGQRRNRGRQQAPTQEKPVETRVRRTFEDAGEYEIIPEVTRPRIGERDPHRMNTEELAQMINYHAQMYGRNTQLAGQFAISVENFKDDITRKRAEKLKAYSREPHPVSGKIKNADYINSEVITDPDVVALEDEAREFRRKLAEAQTDAKTHDKMWMHHSQERRARLDSWHYDPENLRLMDMEREAQERMEREERVRSRNGKGEA